MTEPPTSVELFCSYADTDEPWLRKLETHLSLLKQQNLISFWHDRLVAPGTDWARSIDTHLETASVILLLVSADFLDSDYCYSAEMKRALERQEEGEARIIPILVRPVDWTDAPFAHLQALPTDARPIASWRSKETALAEVAAGLRRVIVEELPQISARAPRAVVPDIWNNPFWEQQLGPDHPHVAASLNGLATLYHEQGKYAEAESLYQRVLSIREQQLGPKHLDVATSLDNLAIVYSDQGKFASAEPLYQRALRIREQQLGPEHFEVADTLNELATLYWMLGKYAEAEPLLQRALRIWEQQLGLDHPHVAEALNGLAGLYQQQGKFVEAVTLLQRALRIQEQQLGPEHPEVANSLHNLAILYFDQGKFTEAQPLHQRALHIWEQRKCQT